MPVKAADPAATELDKAFESAMGTPPKPKEPAAPPDVDADAPHGRDDAGQPLAPFGRNKDGSVRRTRAGRKPKEDQARTGPAAPAAPEPGKGKPEPRNYVPALTETADAAWLVMAVGGKVGPGLPLVGRLIPGQKLAAQAKLFKAHQDALVGAVQFASMHSAAAARLAARLERGEITWTLMFGFMVMPFVMQSATMWRLKEDARLGEEGPTVAELATKTEADIDDFMAAMGRQFAEATAAAQLGAELLTAAGQAEAEGLNVTSVPGGNLNGAGH